MLAPLAGAGAPATCSLWFLAMDPRRGARPTVARKATLSIDRMRAAAIPSSCGSRTRY